MRPDESVVVGRFNGPWGVRGWVKIWSETRPPTAIFDYQPWLVGDRGDSLEIEQWQQSGPRLVAKLSGVDTPEQATALGRQTIRVARSTLPELEPGEYYWHDLIGLEVINLEGHVYGRVEKMQETGAHDVLEIHGEDGIVLIPFVTDEFVRQVDLDGGRITVDWPVDWIESE
ncbi:MULTISPECIES: ribosome maturation factor RimM [unclassified Wenzhouxiangella]|uniref:ribosome maturation factor RimM n=1 Tax=unclassified Wenzhouxiangella TaxID=2613841 RepID=UPI000E3253C1|nr:MULTISPECIES: ribosome maturation factor RimM [unclassified Wenzhouxiangella]RFF26397.1 ribosome maturation factor RimM [Wenzhouxiangella sp. 15181]RFP67330.1 ribosome maturation factor RimM [Wenzhouxiangella sp. 15190]